MIVIKLGGTEGLDFSSICSDVKTILQQDQDVILVHGGSAETNQLAEKLGYPPRFITSPSGFTSRYTDRETMEIFMMSVNGKMNTLLVERLQQAGMNALGLSGLDGRLMVATRKETVQSIENGKRKIIRDDFTGKIELVNSRLISILLKEGYLPVISPIAISHEGFALNVDADRASAMVAAAMNSETLILLTGAPGLLKSFPDESTLISNLKFEQIKEALSFAEGRMKKKVLAAEEAISNGVKKVIISDGRITQPIQKAFSGYGTHIT
jgi:[amino group carrier protein]-L-2-aminoadipate 6-kinase